MSQIRLNHICKSYQGTDLAVKDFNLDIGEKEFIVFVGPSGCGKSTVLRMIAGLEEITSGELWMNGKLMNYEEPGKRNVSMVFQNYALYPHMSIYDNLAFSLAIRKVPKKEIKKRVTETARMLGLEQLLDRRPAQLSGGQKQRVAIGSAILREPNAFLMDEPLSNLDAKMRTQMRVEIAGLYNRLNTTFIYVTHDQTEAMTLGTRIVVLKEGVIQQVDTPQNLYDHPASRFVAGFIGSPSMNFVDANVLSDASGIAIESAGDGVEASNSSNVLELKLNDNQTAILKRLHYEGQEVTLGIRPGDFILKKNAGGQKENASQAFSVKVLSCELLGSDRLVYFMWEGVKCVADISADDEVARGDVIEICMKLDKIHLFNKNTEASIFAHGEKLAQKGVSDYEEV